nr:hypothetical protein [Candidatus Omnitrophota bacterium]
VFVSIDICGECEDTHEDCHDCIACCHVVGYAAVINNPIFSLPTMAVSDIESRPIKALDSLYAKVAKHPPKILS